MLLRTCEEEMIPEINNLCTIIFIIAVVVLVVIGIVQLLLHVIIFLGH